MSTHLHSPPILHERTDISFLCFWRICLIINKENNWGEKTGESWEDINCSNVVPCCGYKEREFDCKFEFYSQFELKFRFAVVFSVFFHFFLFILLVLSISYRGINRSGDFKSFPWSKHNDSSNPSTSGSADSFEEEILLKLKDGKSDPLFKILLQLKPWLLFDKLLGRTVTVA
jgi:hypothetical protein